LCQEFPFGEAEVALYGLGRGSIKECRVCLVNVEVSGRSEDIRDAMVGI